MLSVPVPYMIYIILNVYSFFWCLCACVWRGKMELNGSTDNNHFCFVEVIEATAHIKKKKKTAVLIVLTTTTLD